MSTLTLYEIKTNIDELRKIGDHLDLTNDQVRQNIITYLRSINADPALQSTLTGMITDADRPAVDGPQSLEPVDPAVLAWLRPDWTPELFLQATQGYDDSQRQVAVLKTRDIPLISWYVNHRAGRPRANVVDARLLESQSKIIKNEWDELVTSIDKHDGMMMRDDQADLFLVVGGLGAYYPATMNQDFIDMVRANFTRIDDNLADAERTQKKWSDLGIPCAVTPNPVAKTYPVLVTEECVYNGDSYAVGKFLKSYKFTDACYTDNGLGNTAIIK